MHLSVQAIWVLMPENLILLHVNNNGTDQPVHPHSLISAIAICSLENAISKLATCKISRFYLVSLAEQAGLSMILLDISKTRFLMFLDSINL